MEPNEVEQLAKIDALESQESELLDDNRCLELQLVTVMLEKERHEAGDGESTKAVTEAKVELVNAKEAWRVLEGRTSADGLALRSAMEERNRAQNEVATPSAKLQLAKGAFAATTDHLSGIPITCRLSKLQCRYL